MCLCVCVCVLRKLFIRMYKASIWVSYSCGSLDSYRKALRGLMK